MPRNSLFVLFLLPWFAAALPGQSPNAAEPAENAAAPPGQSTPAAKPAGNAAALPGQSTPAAEPAENAAAQAVGNSPTLPNFTGDVSGSGKGAGASSEPRSKKNGEFFAAPIPIVNPTIGSGLGGLAGYIFQLNNDPKARPTTIGGGGFATSNGSWGAIGMVQASVRDDRYRIRSFGGVLTINYEYFGEGGGDFSLPLNVQGTGVDFDLLRKIRGNWFAGPRYQFFTMNTSIRFPTEGDKKPPLPEDQLQVNAGALGFHVQQDSRDSMFYPRNGVLFDAEGNFFDGAFGGDFAYQKIEFAFNHYIKLGRKQVLAYRAKVCGTEGDVPFFSLCSFGRPEDVRGYKFGRYQDRAMWATQAEYRLELPYRFGVAAFAGVGEVTPSFSQINANRWLPGGGIGVRWTVAKKNHLNLRVDYAWGRYGSNAFYISVGEAF